jgi:glycosylphosphatidylinositol deacylase
MGRRSSVSTDDDDESSLELDKSNDDPNVKLSSFVSRSSPARTLRTSLDWKHGEGHNGLPSTSHAMSRPALPSGPLNAPSKEKIYARTAGHGRRTWSIPFFVLIASTIGMSLFFGILYSIDARQPDPKGCRMSYMRPSYVAFTEFDTEHTRFATKYSLYLYREQGVDKDTRPNGIPVLFIPGNAGSYKQVRPIAAEAANHFYHNLQHDDLSIDSGIRNLDFFTVDFNEDITAFHGQTLLDQAEYLNEAVRFILSLYTDPHRTVRDSHLPDPTSVIILGHSMGGVVARTMLVQPNYQSNSINTIITMSAPHARPPVTFDGEIVRIYNEINEYWRQAYSQKWANNNPLWHVTLVSIAGGSLDTVVPSDYASLESLVPDTHGFTVFSTGIPTVWTSMDHQAILWCDQFRKVIASTLFDIVDVNRASQTRPRADRMRAFKKRLLTGLEQTAEKSTPARKPNTLLTIDDDSRGILSTGERLSLRDVGATSHSQAYLLPIPHQPDQQARRFTLLSDRRLDVPRDGKLEVLLCNFLPLDPSSTGSPMPFDIDLTTPGATGLTKLICKNVASDVILLPPSTAATRNPFYLEGEPQTTPFSYLRYELDQLAEHQFVAVVDKAGSATGNFLTAEFSEETEFLVNHETELLELLSSGLSVKLPVHRPMAIEIRVPSLKSSLFAYDLDVTYQQAGNAKELFAPLIRQYLEHPHESRYFVNARHARIALHGVAPYLPPALQHRPERGVAFEIWADPMTGTEISISLKVDWLASLGQLYMRYRTVFAAFPLLIVTLALRKQFRVYDATGDFIPFTKALDMSIRYSIPLLLVSLTLLSISFRVVLKLFGHFSWTRGAGHLSSTGDYLSDDLLIGTDDPFFWFLTPIVGIVSLGVCVGLHFATLILTHTCTFVYGLVIAGLKTEPSESQQASYPAFVPGTPRRRMVTTALLLFLVATFIPYQFAYLVACLVQLFTTIRALRIKTVASSVANSNFHHYAHSILLLMLWVLPINLPILAVWVRNLAVHWLTPFSSHHNVLSIMPFILLVENMTTGRMVPQMSSWLRHITSILLFATALSAGIFGVSHAYLLHHLVNLVAVWLVAVHSTANSWSLAGLGAMFEGNTEVPKARKTP